MFANIEAFKKEADTHLETFNAFASKYFTTDQVAADHICYKCGSHQIFETIRQLLESESVFIYQSIISNRRIAYIKFKEPILSVCGPIWFLELSDQKPDGSQVNGFDHIEVTPSNLAYEAMVAILTAKEEVIHSAKPHHTTDDVVLENGFVFRCSTEPLLNKIKRDEMI